MLLLVILVAVGIVITVVTATVVHSKPQEEPRCAANVVDGCRTFPAIDCPHGLCLSHCICWCRGVNKHEDSEVNS